MIYQFQYAFNEEKFEYRSLTLFLFSTLKEFNKYDYNVSIIAIILNK